MPVDIADIKPIQSLYQDVAYGENEVKSYVKYSEFGHGPDGSIFLDRFFASALENLKGKTVLDIGCGGGTWSIYAAQQGGDVCAIDIQPEMVSAAQEKIAASGFLDKIKVSVGNVSEMTFENEFFDREISICVGCNLPTGVFEKSFEEMARTLKSDGVAIIGIPHSLAVVFTDGSKTETETREHINEVLGSLPENPEDDLIRLKLGELKEVLSATFYVSQGKLVLLTDESSLQEGEKI